MLRARLPLQRPELPRMVLARFLVFGALLFPLVAEAGDHLPEPMVFDLVRGLGAARGELEANTLGIGHLGEGGAIHWAPEVEFAFRDGAAVEIELPMANASVVALKVAGQATFGRPATHWTHGAQAIVEVLLDGSVELAGLYLVGGRLGGPFSLLGMSGVRLHEHPLERWVDLLQNTSVFADLGERFVVGVETNLACALGRPVGALVMPQVHLDLVRHVRLQAGVGAATHLGAASGRAAARLIVER